MDDRPRFGPGDRVRVHQDPGFGGPWPAEPSGVVTSAGEVREFPTGLRRFYWVTFDEPQLDADGDGPYIDAAEVNEIYLGPAAS
jgi:hypothetical protein